jgi:iron complex outermembrane recepter protein
MKNFYLSSFFTLIALFSFAQNATLKGSIKDAESKEALIGASIVVKGTTKGVISDFDGSYSLELKKGEYTIVFSYVGYTPIEENLVVNGDGDMQHDIFLSSSIALKELIVSGALATERKTPVAFSNISTVKMKEELASQDIPMILNSTPGAYATQQGGGDGDARITIRGFSQRNVAVMLDGIPVNDMENGQVFWSNWFGLGLVTRDMQVQRGLGSSKISIPSVGGTINILTRGIKDKSEYEAKQEVGAGGFYQSTLGFNTGRLKGNWGATGAFSYKKNDGFVDMNYSKALFYFLKIEKEFGKHLISLSGFGGPQEHGQRAFATPIALTDSKLARELGVSEIDIKKVKEAKGIDRGLLYSDAWGILNGERKSIRINYYHKPQFSLRHSWEISKKTFLSNVAYLSVGNGGGTNIVNTIPFDSTTGQIKIQQAYEGNQGEFVDKANVIRASVNNHFWYGLLSTFNHEISKNLNFAGGLDLRSYKGEHYRTVYDMLGGKRFKDTRNARANNSTTLLNVGDKFFYNYDGFVRWSGAFGTLEYSKKNLSTFLNISGAISQYKYHDKMFAKVIFDTSYVSYAVKESDVPKRNVIRNGVLYTTENVSKASLDYAAKNNLIVDSTSAQDQILGWLNIPSFTFKTGASYNLDKHHNVFMNVGYLSRATRYNNVFYSVFSNAKDLGKIKTASNYENELIKSIEFGYKFKSSIFSGNLNAYYTDWKNKPVENAPLIQDPFDPNEQIPVQINGISARHKGIELDFAFQPFNSLKIEGLASLGDWIWTSKAIQTLPDGSIKEFDPTGVHVGDAAQTQLGFSIRYAPIKGAYISTRTTFFGRNFSNFDPETLTGVNVRRESWQQPDYFISDLHAGYTIKLRKRSELSLRGSILNLLNVTYIADAKNNDTLGNVVNSSNFDASSASVFFGLPRRWTVSAEISF